MILLRSNSSVPRATSSFSKRIDIHSQGIVSCCRTSCYKCSLWAWADRKGQSANWHATHWEGFWWGRNHQIGTHLWANYFFGTRASTASIAVCLMSSSWFEYVRLWQLCICKYVWRVRGFSEIHSKIMISLSWMIPELSHTSSWKKYSIWLTLRLLSESLWRDKDREALWGRFLYCVCIWHKNLSTSVWVQASYCLNLH